MEPVRTYELEGKLTDGVVILVRGEVYNQPILPMGDQVYNLVKITNKKTGIVIGLSLYQTPMEQEELEDKVKEVLENAESHLLPVYKSKIQN